MLPELAADGHVYRGAMVLASISVADPSVLELAGKLRDGGFGATAARVEAGYERRVHMLGLDAAEREEILQALGVDCPAGLVDLHTVLLQEQDWRDRDRHPRAADR